ncbi:hypothetical protein ACKI1I_39960 [Streptomyces turgidiscabies]|uniref:Uncharacterized protein n=1 Tax=Streptomyces turgidiscabies (strain Car8) TaxID=698760 RepID=L7ER28_STRT8|nr:MULTISPECIES: hypothetical protein [Streptomyces]ELP61364.1 hypothetical protein STRTUCAR8_06718 [Streptomyces turgidiscabies Car8]MDX3493517.1 hypothetical protein [Streptomyces turgidiscabies]GAQ76813.1 hypothetical protein T45_08617 [Streptomyces turgidiscabies]
MDSDDECTGPELDPGRPRRTGPNYNIFLGPGPSADATEKTPAHLPGAGRGRADVDDTIRLLRNLAALVVFSSTTLTLVAFAGIGMGVPPWFCLAVAFGGGPLTIWGFVMTFETVRSSLPDGTEDPPSNGEP